MMYSSRFPVSFSQYNWVAMLQSTFIQNVVIASGVMLALVTLVFAGGQLPWTLPAWMVSAEGNLRLPFAVSGHEGSTVVVILNGLRLLAERRILDRDWSNYNTNNVVYAPRGMSAEQLFDGYYRLQNAVHTIPAIVQRFWGTTSKANFWLPMNYGFRRSIKKLTAHARAFRPAEATAPDTRHAI